MGRQRCLLVQQAIECGDIRLIVQAGAFLQQPDIMCYRLLSAALVMTTNVSCSCKVMQCEYASSCLCASVRPFDTADSTEIQCMAWVAAQPLTVSTVFLIVLECYLRNGLSIHTNRL